MKAALIHDWLTGLRGGEKVLEVLCELLPRAPIYTLLYVPGSVSPSVEKHPIRTSWMNLLPGAGKFYRQLLPLMPAAARSLKVHDYDLVVAVSHCAAHGANVVRGGRFVAYYLTPMRYAWDQTESYFFGRETWDPRYRVLKALRPALRRWDRKAARRVNEPVAVSECVRRRLRRFYGRDAPVIHPPVDTDFYRPASVKREDFYLWVGALAAYKRIDLALEAFRRLGRRLVVIGTGQSGRWARRAAPRTSFFSDGVPTRSCASITAGAGLSFSRERKISESCPSKPRLAVVRS